MSTDNGNNPHKSWRELAEQASTETDPAKLQQLIKELCDALDRTAPQKAKPIKKTDIPVDE